MYNKSQKSLGIPSKVYNVVHKIALIAILHSTLIAPSQNLMYEYYKIKSTKVNKGYSSNNSLNSSYNNFVDTNAFENNEPSLVAQKQIVLGDKTSNFSSKFFYSDVKIGSIGKSSKVNFDDPSDNVFNFNFDKKQVANTTVFLKYSVYGIDPKSIPSKSINSTYVTGGYAYKESNQWSEVVEEIDSNWLRNGRNSIFFSIPENSGYSYKVKDVTLFTAQTKSNKNDIILNNDGVFIKKDNKLYINGFFKKSKIEDSDIKVLANNQELKVLDNKFENFIEFKDEKFIDLKVFQNGILIAKDLISIDKVVEADKLYTIENKFAKNSKYITAFSNSTLEVEGAKLSVLDGSLVESKEISVSMLRAIDIAPLESGFINVTKDKKAFRFLPDGTKFAKPVKIEIEYDEKLIPMGYTPKDIKTFYFDIQHKKWFEVAKDSVDQANKKVVSSTTHFTDYINGIIQTPESPQTSAFTPTMMNDIKAASPESQIALISPPEVSQKGSANVSYPIKLPAGRNGMQPQVAIQYSSEGGSGWLGEGWGISTPAITLDTRWGTPVFDPTNESEIYNLNGEQLMYPKLNEQDWMPNRHFDAVAGVYSTQERIRITDAIFTFRKQGDFSKIERKGASPSEYYWKVTSTDGTISWYGGKDAVVNNAVIKNDQGKIVQWSLYLVEDVYTNNIKYNYTSNIMSGQSGANDNLNNGLIYNLNNIVYTGFGNDSGKYKVEFVNETTIIRPDISINSRLGLKQITPFRLDQIKVSYDNSPIRSYKLEYATGKFEKSLLTKIIENDAAGNNFYEHKLEYYDDIAANNNALFGESIKVRIDRPNPNYILGFGNILSSSVIGSNQSREIELDIRPSFGIEFKRKTNNLFKNITIGFPLSYTWSKDLGKFSMVDINGDGLDDIVYQTSEGLKYLPHQNEYSHSFGEPVGINNIGTFYQNKGKTSTRFLPFDLAFGKKKRKYFGWKKFLNKSYTDIYFTDGNGDGLMDIVKDNKVYFNYLDNNYLPTYTTSSEVTPNMVITAAAVPVPPNPLDQEDPGDVSLDLQTNYDAVKVWVAPCGGYVRISDIVTLNAVNSDDTVVYSIETVPKIGLPSIRIYLKELTAIDNSVSLEIDKINSYYPLPLGLNSNQNFSVASGQKFYFRVHKNNNSKNCVVDFNPTISFYDVNTGYDENYIDSNYINQSVSQYSDSFILSDSDEFELPGTGTVAVQWPDINVNQLSDDVTFKIIKVSEIGSNVSEEVVYEKFCPQNSNTIVAENTNETSYNVSNLQITSSNPEEELIYFYATVDSDSNVRWKEIEWKPKFTYTPDANAIALEIDPDPVRKYLIPKYSIYSAIRQPDTNYIFNPYNDCNINWDTPNNNQTYGIKINTVLEPTHTELTSTDNGEFLLVVKKDGHYIGKRTITITNGVVTVSNNNDPINFFTGNIYNTGNNVIISVEYIVDGKSNLEIYNKFINSIPKINYPFVLGTCSGSLVEPQPFFIGYDWTTPFPQNDITLTPETSLKYYNKGLSCSIFVKDLNTALGPLYNNWGQFFYNDELDTIGGVSSDSYGKLINDAIVDDPSITYPNNLLSQFGVDTSLCDNAPDPEECINDQLYNNLGLPAESEDFSNYTDEQIDDLQANISLGFSNPAICLLPARPVRNLEDTNNQIERWEGIFSSNFISATQGQVGDFDQMFFENITEEQEENEMFPPQQANLNTGMFALSKYHKSLSSSFTFGAGSLNFNRSSSNGGNKYSHAKNDFIDLNGDRYPDVFTEDNLQYSNMTGGHKASIGNHGFGAITTSYSKNWGVTLSRKFLKSGDPEIISVTVGTNLTDAGSSSKGTQNKIRYGQGGASATMSVSGQIDGKNSGDHFWQDINGDGLSDRVNVNGDNFNVQLNNGYINLAATNNVFSGLVSNETRPLTSYSVGITPIDITSITDTLNSAGDIQSSTSLNFNLSLGVGRSSGSSVKTLQDINGDGLTDILTESGSIVINKGNSYSSNTMSLSTSNLNFKHDNVSTSMSIGGEVSMFFTIYRFLVVVLKVGITIGGNYNLSISDANKSLKDFDGDGYLDFVEKYSDGINYYPSNIKRTNKLKTVINPLGGSFTMDYSPQNLTYNNPNANWAMTSLIVNDARDIANDGADTYSTTFAYENGKYDRRERAFYGYETVKLIDKDNTGVVYRVSITKYHNDNYFLEGLVKESYLTNDIYESEIHSKTINTYQIKKTFANGTIDTSTNEPFTYDVGGTEGRRQASVLLMKTTSELYEFGTTPIVTETNFEYDEYGRVTKYDNVGNIALSQDNYYSNISYHTLNNNILGVPKKITVHQAGATVREREVTSFNANTGDVLEIKTKLNATENAVTKMTYDQYGNILTITYPQNINGQSMKYTYTYDMPLNKYVESIKDSFNYVSTATYDPKFDTLLTSTDLTGNTMTYEYDNVGRIVKIIAPKEAGNANPYTIKFEYFNKHSQLTPYGYQNCVTPENFLPFAVTKHFDVEHPDNPIETVTIVDGLARPIQVKKDIEINTNTNTSQAPTYVEYMSVSGMVTYDIYGRAIKQYHPKKEVKSCATNFVVNQVSDPLSNYFSTVEYDVLDRTVKTIDPANNISQMQYSLANDVSGNLSIKTKSIVEQNAITGAQTITESYADIQGKTTSTINIGGPGGNIVTKFVYNAIGELLSYEDAEGLITKYKYDNAGRKIEVVHPDSGMSTYKYDTSSNLINSQTANLINNGGESITYKYDYNRLKHVIFPTIAGNQNISDVHYEYGPAGASGINNQRGRLIFQQDATGTQEFEYGNMGEMVYNKRTIVAPNLPTRVFESKFDYDSWNRIQKMIYPDGEVLNYSYDKGGNLSKMSGTYSEQPYDYIQRIDYDYFEQRTYIKYGNNTETKYTYANDLRRLNNLLAKASSGQALFDNNYSYDKVGNILGVSNTAPYNTATTLGGTYNHTYTYDKLNRLSTASGNFTGQNKKSIVNKSNYTLKMEYNNTHGIILKEQVHNVNNYQTYDTTHESEYHYVPNTHRINNINNADTNDVESFEYDANGNTTIHIKNDGIYRQMLWDESNRLRVVSDEGDLQHYIYDAAGERILKASSSVEQVFQNGQLVNSSTTSIGNYTTYASAYLVIDATQQYSKHYYAGAQRIVSKMGEQDVEIFNEQLLKEVGPQTDPKMGTDGIKQLQISDLQNRLEKAKLGRAIFKDYKVGEPLVEEEGDELEKANTSGAQNNAVQALLTGLYFFHPDHLGTSTFLTDANGNPYQFFLNLPFGETMYEQHSYTESYANPYKFNGKELDAETGLYYYGARYYNPRIATWYSVDPLAEKYPNINPYVYVADNPINAIDPDGRKILFVNGHYNRFAGWAIGASEGYKNYWDKGFGEAAQKFFNDYSSLKNYNYINGSSDYGGDQSGSEREKLGYEYAAANYHHLIEGLAEGEAFQMVTHSEGSAYGAGIARYLIEKGHKVENVVHLSSDEGDEFETPWGPDTYQLSYYGDWVTGNKEIGNGGVDYFGVIDKFDSASDRFFYSHGSTKNASVFKELNAMRELIKKSDTGGYVPNKNAKSSNGTIFKELNIYQVTKR